MLENQTPELFQDVNKPKYNGTLNLDRWAASPPVEFCVCSQCVWVPAGFEGLGRGCCAICGLLDCPGVVIGTRVVRV